MQACPPSAWYRFRKFARRNKRALLTASVVALAVVLTRGGQSACSSGGPTRTCTRPSTASGTPGRERRNSYFSGLPWRSGNGRATTSAGWNSCSSGCPADLRGWEWHYLKRLRYGALPPLRHESAVYSVAFSPDGQYLATATQDGVVRLWQAKTGQELRKWQAHENNATSVAFSPDGRYLASGGWDGKVKVWDVQTVLQGEVPAPLLQLEHTSRVECGV